MSKELRKISSSYREIPIEVITMSMGCPYPPCPKHGKCSNIWILPLKHPADLLINIIYYNLCQRSSISKARRLHAVLAKIHGLRHGPCMHPCTNLDLLGIGQNVFTTARFNICIDATKKNSNPSTLELVTRSISKMSPVSPPLKIF